MSALSDAEPGSFREAVRDAILGREEEVDETTLRIAIAIATKCDEVNRKLARTNNLLITASGSIGGLALSLVGGVVFGVIG